MSEETNNRPNDQMHDPVYMRTRLRVLIREFLARSDREADPRKQMAFLHEAADLARRLRENKGYSRWAELVFAVFVIVAIVLLLAPRWPKSQSFGQPDDVFRVIDRQSDFNLTLQRVHKGEALEPSVMFFCSDTEGAPFEPGHTVTALAYDYYPKKFCYSIERFSLMRDAHKCPIVPSNCRHIDCSRPEIDHVVCEGKPQFE